MRDEPRLADACAASEENLCECCALTSPPHARPSACTQTQVGVRTFLPASTRSRTRACSSESVLALVGASSTFCRLLRPALKRLWPALTPYVSATTSESPTSSDIPPKQPGARASRGCGAVPCRRYSWLYFLPPRSASALLTLTSSAHAASALCTVKLCAAHVKKSSCAALQRAVCTPTAQEADAPRLHAAAR